MKKLLIGGCSFSEFRGLEQNINAPNTWISWSDFLNRDFKDNVQVVNRAQSSFGQSKIVESVTDELIKQNFKVDYVIIQWSAVGRAYSLNQQDFFERITKQWEVPFSPHVHEYMLSGDKEGWTTNLLNEIDYSFYIASLTQIVLMKNLLENHNIPYTMFWGWGQITTNIEHKVKHLLDKIYDDNFWLFETNGGMSEYIINKIGEDKGIIPNNFHPTTEGQKLFYDTIITTIVKNKII